MFKRGTLAKRPKLTINQQTLRALATHSLVRVVRGSDVCCKSDSEEESNCPGCHPT